MVPKSSFGHPGIRIFEILGGFDRGLIFDDFSSGPQNEKNLKKGGGGVKTKIFTGRFGGRAGVPEELLESAKSIRIRQSLQ